MMNKSSDSIQAIQELLGRTHKGRTIRNEAIPAVKSWRANISTQYGKSECQLCGLILKSNYFIKGCVNCGATDVMPAD